MKRWAIGSNDYFCSGSFYLENAKWYVFSIERLVMFICDHFPSFSLPSFIYVYDTDGEKYSLKEYYGTTQDLFHIFICSPITQWCFRKTNSIPISFPLEMLKEKFPDEFKNSDYQDFYNESEYKTHRESNLEYSKELEKEFRNVYLKLQNMIDERIKHEN